MRVRAADGLRSALLVVRHRRTRSTRGAGARWTTCWRRSASYGCRLVEVTGGEPLLQPDVYPLMQRLLDGGHERAARDRRSRLDRARAGRRRPRSWTSSAPAAARPGRCDWENLARLGATRRGEVRDRRSGRLRVREGRSSQRGDWASRVGAILFSPVHGVLAPADLAAWVLADRLPVRVQLQVHKYIWEPGRAACSRAGEPGPGRVRREGEGPCPHRPRAVVLLSGGLDSATAAAIARSDGFDLYALTIDYGQRHRVRDRGGPGGRARARGVARHVELQVDLSAFGGSALTDRIDVPKDRDLDDGRHPVHLRAGAQHRLPVAGAGLGGGAGRRRTSSSA